jgi:2OG-Fe(II) oxygenase superfamily
MLRADGEKMNTLEFIREMGLDFFLPRAKMKEIATSARDSYQSAVPFPHVVFDDFFDPALLNAVLSEFPAPGQIRWQQFDNEREIKLASSVDANFGPMTRLMLYHLNSITFLDFLSTVTGIPDLIADPCFDGGGLHQIRRGGKLGIHADFNKHRRYNLDRRLNVLLYLNKNWKEEYGGQLELWDRSMSRCEAKILPTFNRMMIFSTTDFTYHGHPDPLQCPEGMTRKSLALYYFTNGRPGHEISGEHSTLFKGRSKDDFRLTMGQRLRHLASDLLPPIITRQLKRSGPTHH